MTNSADPDQLASGSTLFAKAGYIRVQQDKGLDRKVPGLNLLEANSPHDSIGHHCAEPFIMTTPSLS